MKTILEFTIPTPMGDMPLFAQYIGTKLLIIGGYTEEYTNRYTEEYTGGELVDFDEIAERYAIKRTFVTNNEPN